MIFVAQLLLLLHFPAAAAHPDCHSASASCGACTAVTGCGWSVVRRACFAAHPVATATDDCPSEDEGAATLLSPSEYLDHARTLLSPMASAYGPSTLRAAYVLLEKGASAAAAALDGEETHSNVAVAVQIEATRAQLAGTLAHNALEHSGTAIIAHDRAGHRAESADCAGVTTRPRHRAAHEAGSIIVGGRVITVLSARTKVARALRSRAPSPCGSIYRLPCSSARR